MPSNEHISEAAWERAALKKVRLSYRYGASLRAYLYSLRNYTEFIVHTETCAVTNEEAIAAQAEINRERDPIASNEEIDAAIEWLDNEDAMLSQELHREVFAGIIEAAFKARAKRGAA